MCIDNSTSAFDDINLTRLVARTQIRSFLKAPLSSAVTEIAVKGWKSAAQSQANDRGSLKRLKSEGERERESLGRATKSEFARFIRNDYCKWVIRSGGKVNTWTVLLQKGYTANDFLVPFASDGHLEWVIQNEMAQVFRSEWPAKEVFSPRLSRSIFKGFFFPCRAGNFT